MVNIENNYKKYLEQMINQVSDLKKKLDKKSK